jgi:hypothetical protein
MPIQTLLDIARLRDNDPLVGLIQENLLAAPEMATFMARTIPGTTYQTAVVSGQSKGSFRPANQGVTLTPVTLEQRLQQTFLYENPVEIDMSVDYAAQGLQGMPSVEMIVANQKMLTAMQQIGAQIWNGTSTDSFGFTGVKQFTPKYTSTQVAGASPIWVDAGGTTSGAASSIYAVKFGLQNTHIVFGSDNTFGMSQFIDQQLTDAAGRKYMGRVASLRAWIGLQLGNIYCAGRVGNVTTDAGKGATDTLLSNLVRQFPVAFVPDAIYMSRRSAAQLAQSRPRTGFFTPGVAKAGSTVVSAAYTVDDYEGIPIIRTDMIPDTDATE